MRLVNEEEKAQNETDSLKPISKLSKMFILRHQNIFLEGIDKHMLTVRDVTMMYQLEEALSLNKYLDMLTATISHEILTPLNCIITFSNALRRKTNEEEILQLAKKIHGSSTLCRF